TQGVRLINLQDNDLVVGVARLMEKDDDEDDENGLDDAPDMEVNGEAEADAADGAAESGDESAVSPLGNHLKTHIGLPGSHRKPRRPLFLPAGRGGTEPRSHAAKKKISPLPIWEFPCLTCPDCCRS